MNNQRIIITGGAGFIGSALTRHLIESTNHQIMVIDALTYAGNQDSLKSIADSPRFEFVHLDIRDGNAVNQTVQQWQPSAIMHLAAESHVDRSIDGPADFIHTNILGTYNLLEASRNLITTKPDDSFRFLHVSTDEVYGSLGDEGLFTESTPYDPRSPYSASKASSDHLVSAWGHTYGLPVLITNCSNNYGPYHFPEKLIPLVILNALDEKPLPIYGKGDNVRDWLFVEDHARALYTVLTQGTAGETYNVGGNSERTNLQVVQAICAALDRIKPRSSSRSYADLITFVKDRPGHDRRYAIDASKIKNELGWTPSVDFEQGLENTINWYLANAWWWHPIRTGKYAGERLGVKS